MTSQSIPYQLSQAIVSALRLQFEADGVVVRDNPTSLADLNTGSRVVFVEDDADDLRDKPGQAEGRTFGVNVGVINRTADARAGADADMVAIKACITTAVAAAALVMVRDKALLAAQAVREGRHTYKVEGIDVGGALVLTRFEIDYRTPSVR